MSENYNSYLQFLAAEYNILYLGGSDNEKYNSISSYFMTSSKVDINKEILDKFTSTLSKRHINFVIIDVEDNDELVIEFYEVIKKFNEDILVMLVFNPKEYKKLFEIVPLVDITVSYPVDMQIFYKRIFVILSTSYAMKSIGKRELIVKKKDVKEDVVESFFDIYEGSTIFISDDLLSMVNSLNAGNLSHVFFINISEKLDEVAYIFSKIDQTSSVSPIFTAFAVFLRELDLNSIEPNNLKAFNYLPYILTDISAYLLSMFVDRIFTDVYIFEDSLQNNIQFMKNSLNGNEDDCKLEFFS